MYIQPLILFIIGLYNVNEPRCCNLLKSVYEGQGPSIVATGQVYPYIPDATSHFEVILEGCIRVQVDRVMDGFTGLPLPVPGPYLKTLGDAHGSFTQWPKSSIILEEVKKI